jgi:hypothetical protein
MHVPSLRLTMTVTFGFFAESLTGSSHTIQAQQKFSYWAWHLPSRSCLLLEAQRKYPHGEVKRLKTLTSVRISFDSIVREGKENFHFL